MILPGWARAAAAAIAVAGIAGCGSTDAASERVGTSALSTRSLPLGASDIRYAEEGFVDVNPS